MTTFTGEDRQEIKDADGPSLIHWTGDMRATVMEKLIRLLIDMEINP
jgi:hypothetical protein